MPSRLRVFTVVTSILSLVSSAASATPIQWTAGSGGNGHYYDIVLAPGGISWAGANAAASAAGGHLATITSAAEGAFVYANLVDNATYWNQEPGGSDLGPWLGGYQTSDNGSQASQNWVWVTGETWSYTAWHSGEPNNFTGVLENYLSYKCWPTANCRSSNWNDLPDNISVYGTSVLAYVVEWDAPTSIQNPAAGSAQLQAFPNPFSRSTRISLTLPAEEPVVFEIFDVGGRRLARLVSAAAREHSLVWDGRDGRGAFAPSGVYFARAAARSVTMTRRLVHVE